MVTFSYKMLVISSGLIKRCKAFLMDGFETDESVSLWSSYIPGNAIFFY